MASQGKSNGGSGGFKERMLHYLYSGERKHVLTGMAIVTVIFGAPWFLKMNKGTKHQSHQDYLEKADKARRERLSSSSK